MGAILLPLRHKLSGPAGRPWPSTDNEFGLYNLPGSCMLTYSAYSAKEACCIVLLL